MEWCRCRVGRDVTSSYVILPNAQGSACIKEANPRCLFRLCASLSTFYTGGPVGVAPRVCIGDGASAERRGAV